MILGSRLENQASSGVRAQQFRRHRSARGFVKRFAGTMQRNHIGRIDFLECLDRISDVVLLIGREMKAPDNGMNFFHAGGGLGLPDRVDHAAMAARSQDDKPASFQIESRRDLVLKLIWYDGRTTFRLAEALGIAADASVETNGHCAR